MGHSVEFKIYCTGDIYCLKNQCNMKKLVGRILFFGCNLNIKMDDNGLAKCSEILPLNMIKVSADYHFKPKIKDL